MKTYTCKGFSGHYPVGTAAVVRADSPEHAAQLLNAQLAAAGLEPDTEPSNMKEFVEYKAHVLILCDGDY